MYQKLFKSLEKARGRWKNEEELRIAWISDLSKFLNIELHAERERFDSSYNNVIIEFKAPGLFRGKNNSPAFKEAIYDRLKPYIQKKATIDGMDPGQYIGIAIDGEHICFAQMLDGDIVYDELIPFTIESVTMVATALQDSYRRSVTVQHLVEDFGLHSDSGSDLMQALCEALAGSLSNKRNNKIQMLFEEWRTLFGQVADLSDYQISGINKMINFIIPSTIKNELKVPSALFVIHTYNSLIIKLLAAEIVSANGLTSRRAFAQFVATLNDEELVTTMKEKIEKARLFQAAGINGFVEEAIFGWYIDACSKQKFKDRILNGLRQTLIKLSFYRTDILGEARTQDILKGFYQSLVPNELRKSLGEFYTPDWLVDFTIDKLNCTDFLTKRFLDPTCGSGSFLLALVRRVREQAEAKKLHPKDTLNIIIKNIWGFDLNPLAVQTARVNLLIVLTDLLKNCPGTPIELPILMADAIYSPAKNPDNEDEVVTYSIGSQVANLEVKIPSALAFDRVRLDEIFNIMGEQVEQNVEFQETLLRLKRAKTISGKEEIEWEAPLKETYERILSLHRKNWNGIWFRIVRNFFWSATAGSFDFIVGNPPWVRWSKLPELYRQRVKPTCLQYEIFSSTPHHGGNELDISGMITYTVSDKWLRNGGFLSFVITQAHFQSGSSEGFRSFSINKDEKLLPLSVDDMKELRPFPDAANKTAIALFHKTTGSTPKYPVPYYVWINRDGFTKVIPQNIGLTEVYKRIKVEEKEAMPVSGDKSPWAILPIGRFSELEKISGESQWVHGRKGITADLNGIYFVQIVNFNEKNGLVQIETRPEAGKKDIGPKESYWIEPNMLYPLLKGAGDFGQFKFSPKENLYVIVPNNGISKEACEIAEELLDSEYTLTRRYLSDYRELLKQRSTYKRYMSKMPFYSIYNVGEYTFAPYKVVWAEQSKKFASAVITEGDVPLIGKRPYVPDHKVYFVDFYSPSPAYFLCGLLNSNIVCEFVESYSISIQKGNIFKHLNLPKYNSNNAEHQLLAKLVKEAHSNDDQNCFKEIKDLADCIINRNM